MLPLNKMVGLEFRHEEMEALAEEADKWGDGQIIVLLIDSGGGAVVEMEKIHELKNSVDRACELLAPLFGGEPPPPTHRHRHRAALGATEATPEPHLAGAQIQGVAV